MRTSPPNDSKNLRQAEQVVRTYDAIVLTSEEWACFQAMLLDPPQPNDRLQQALDEHARIIRP